MTTTAAPVAARAWWRQSLATALATGVALGLLSDIVWPNIVYGYQIIVGGLAILVPIVVLVLPPTRRFAGVAIALGVGVIAGIALGFNARPTPPPAQIGSVEVMLGRPVNVQLETVQAICNTQDGQLQSLETPNAEDQLVLGDGRRLSVVLGTPLDFSASGAPEQGGGSGPVPSVDISVHWTLPDGSPTETVMSAGPGSHVSASGTFSSGYLAFDSLVVSPLSEQRDPIDLAGTLRWECPEPAS